MRPNRRHFLIGAAAGAAALSLRPKSAQAVVLGAGPAGASAAFLMAQRNPDLNVQLIERDPSRLKPASSRSDPFQRATAPLTLTELDAAGVSVVLDEAVGIDWQSRTIELFSGRKLAFDQLCLAPGTEAVDEGIAGYDARTRHLWPAAWGSRREGQRLQGQMAQLPDRSHVVLRLPAEISHPQVAVDRAVWLARRAGHVTVLDGGHHTDLRDLVRAALPSGRIDWHLAGSGGVVTSVDATRGQIETEAGVITSDLVNFVPKHGAGRIAQAGQLVDASGWCPVDQNASSRIRPEVTILGDGQANAKRLSTEAVYSARRAML